MTRKLETRVRFLRERVAQLTEEALNMEERAGISRWQPSDPQYMETLRYIEERRYHRALGKLQRLVILRLFELHKLNLAQTGTSWLAPDSVWLMVLYRLQAAHAPCQESAATMQSDSQRRRAV